MSGIIYNGHVQNLILKTAGQVPTVPSPPTLTPLNDGWNDTTDILIGEFALNEVDGKLFKRSQLGIEEVGSGGGSGIQSVNGDGVDNTDPNNPIISFPTIVKTQTDWMGDSTVYAEGYILFSSDVLFTGTNFQKYKKADGVQTWVQLDYFPDPNTKQPLHTNLTQFSSISFLNGDFLKFSGTSLIKRTTAEVKTDLGIAADDAATLLAAQNYADAVKAGLSWKNSVRVATVVAGTLATSFANGQTVDGIVIATGDSILIKNQVDQTTNGIYTVNASGAPTRRTDSNSGSKLENAIVPVEEGTSNADTTWRQSTDAVVIGATNIVWVSFGATVPDATETIKGIMRLYNVTGVNTDGSMTQGAIKTELDLKAALASPIFTGTPKAPTQLVGDNSTNISTTAYVDAKIVDAINDGVTTIGPSQNAVFDALFLKSNLITAVGSGSVTRADNTKYYTGKFFSLAAQTSFDTNKFSFDRAVTIVRVLISMRTAVQGSNESVPFYLRRQNVENFLITNLNYNLIPTNSSHYLNIILATPITVNTIDYYECMEDVGLLGTNPTNLSYTMGFYTA